MADPMTLPNQGDSHSVGSLNKMDHVHNQDGLATNIRDPQIEVYFLKNLDNRARNINVWR